MPNDSRWQRKILAPATFKAECPFCGGAYSIETAMPVETAPGVVESIACVIHTVPYCDEFDKAPDAVEFARMARKARDKLRKGSN